MPKPIFKINFNIGNKEESTPKKVRWEIIGYTEYNNRNKVTLEMDDFLQGPSKIPVLNGHSDINIAGIEPGRIIPDTYFVERKIQENKQGRYLHGYIESTNPKFIEFSKNITGFSIEGEPFDDKDWFMNESGEVMIKKGGFDFQAIAALSGEMPGSGGTEIINKKAFFQAISKTFGSETVPKDKKNNNFKTNNIKMEITKEDLQELIAKQIQESTKATFEAIQKEQEEAKKIVFTINKDDDPETQLEAINKQAKEKNLKLTFEIKEDDESEDEDDEDGGDPTDEATKKAVQYQKKMKNAGKKVAFSKDAGDKPETPENIIFETINTSNV